MFLFNNGLFFKRETNIDWEFDGHISSLMMTDVSEHNISAPTISCLYHCLFAAIHRCAHNTESVL